MSAKKLTAVLIFSTAVLIFSTAGGGAAYVLIQKCLSNKSLDSDNKYQYVSYNSSDDAFISEEVL